MDDRDSAANAGDTTRRNFVKGVAATVGGLALTSRTVEAFGSIASAAARAPAPNWADHIGLELYTVRDMAAKDYIGTLEKVAAIGYKEIEPAGGYNNMSPKQFRAELDRLGLKMPSTHSGITAGAPEEVEKMLAGFQIMGIEYTELSQPRPAGGRASGPRRAPATPASPAAERQMREQFIKSTAQARTVDDVKQEAARYNTYGKIARKFGIKLLVHNHTVEFIPCKDSDQLPYTFLLKETDPELVVFQLDIGCALPAASRSLRALAREGCGVPEVLAARIGAGRAHGRSAARAGRQRGYRLW